MGVRPFFWYELADRSKAADRGGRRECDTPSMLRRVVDMAVRARRSPDSVEVTERAASYVHDCNFLD
jgi:hypothetical protein